MVIRVSLSLPHNLLAQGIESYLLRQPAIELVPSVPTAREQHDGSAAVGDAVLLIGLDSLQPATLETLRHRHARHPLQRLVVLADFHQPAELLSTLDAGALACVSTTSQLDDVVQAIRSAAQGHPYLCQQLATLMLQGARLRSKNPGRGSAESQIGGCERGYQTYRPARATAG